VEKKTMMIGTLAFRIRWVSAVLLLLSAATVQAQDEGLETQVPAGIIACEPDELVQPSLQPFIQSSLNPFCMNGGTCKENFMQTPEFPCDCPDGMTGPHCEFLEDEVPSCDLKCFNGGVCQQGFRTWTNLYFTVNPAYLNYCQCKEGFYGNQCKIDGQQCGTTHCLNGGQCISINRDDGTVSSLRLYHCQGQGRGALC
jgi:hypothetical protein